MSFRAGQGGCSGGNTQSGLSHGQTTPPGAKRHTIRCGHGVFCPAAVFLAGGQDRCGYWPPARALRTGQNPPCHGLVDFRIGSYSSPHCERKLAASLRESPSSKLRVLRASSEAGGDFRPSAPPISVSSVPSVVIPLLPPPYFLSSASRTLAASVLMAKGFWMKCISLSRTPWWAMMSAV